MTNLDSNDVSVIRTSDNTVAATIHAISRPYAVAVTPDGAHAYVTNFNAEGSVSVIRTSDNEVTTIVPVQSNPTAVAITPGGTHAYVTNYSSNTVSVIRTSDNEVTTIVPVGSRPSGVAITLDGTHVYVTNYVSNSVSVIRTSDNEVIRTVDVGVRPTNVAITPSGFAFSGFFAPVANGVTNVARAGGAIPVKFSLGGDQGLSVFASGHPRSQPIACAAGTAEGTVEETSSAGGSTLTYEAATSIYTYVWKTERSWGGTCRRLTLQLVDGQVRTADFRFNL